MEEQLAPRVYALVSDDDDLSVGQSRFEYNP